MTDRKWFCLSFGAVLLLPPSGAAWFEPIVPARRANTAGEDQNLPEISNMAPETESSGSTHRTSVPSPVGGKTCVSDTTPAYSSVRAEVKSTKKQVRRRQVKRSATPLVKKISTGTFLSGKPLFRVRVFAVTKCARTCHNLEKLCKFFNFNFVTRECIGFPNLENNRKESRKDWEVWQADTH